MCEALAALRLGFLSRQVRTCQEMMWQAQALAVPVVTNTLMEADRALHGLSNRMNNYQRPTIVELWKRLYDSLSIAPERLLVCANATASILKTRQHELWSDFRAMLAAIITGQPRLGVWFDIGDRLADISWQVYEGRLPLPLTPQQWDVLGVTDDARVGNVFLEHWLRLCEW
jgi:hypothetical protein